MTTSDAPGRATQPSTTVTIASHGRLRGVNRVDTSVRPICIVPVDGLQGPSPVADELQLGDRQRRRIRAQRRKRVNVSRCVAARRITLTRIRVFEVDGVPQVATPRADVAVSVTVAMNERGVPPESAIRRPTACMFVPKSTLVATSLGGIRGRNYSGCRRRSHQEYRGRTCGLGYSPRARPQGMYTVVETRKSSKSARTPWPNRRSDSGIDTLAAQTSGHAGSHSGPFGPNDQPHW